MSAHADRHPAATMMNLIHRYYCRSGLWRRTVRERLIPWVVGQTALGDDVLEIGPGPGATTDVLCERIPRLTCVEAEPSLARALARRMEGRPVEVFEADATELPFEDDRFSGAVCCTMLHHVPDARLQDRLLAEVGRVLAPGAWLVGSDSLTSPLFRLSHVGDTLLPVPPETLGRRLERAGFTDVSIKVAKQTFRFRGRAPGSA